MGVSFQAGPFAASPRASCLLAVGFPLLSLTRAISFTRTLMHLNEN